MAIFFIVFALISVAFAQDCVDKYGNSVPNRGEIKQGNGQYSCWNGLLELKGCANTQYGTVRFGEKVTGEGYELTCVEVIDSIKDILLIETDIFRHRPVCQIFNRPPAFSRSELCRSAAKF